MREPETKEVLLDKLVGIQDVEAAKPICEMDTDMIAECTEYVLELTEEEPPTETALLQMKQRLLLYLFGRKGRVLPYRKGMLRKLLIAAVIVILIVAMSASMMPLGTNAESLLHRWGYYLSQQEIGHKMDFGDYISLRRDGDVVEFKSVRQFIKKTGADLLVPTVLPDGFSVQLVQLGYDTQLKCDHVTFVTNDPRSVSIGVNIGQEEPNLEARELKQQIGDYFCGFASSANSWQCNFNYNGNGYYINAKSYEDVLLILNNMKGSQNK